jgi:serine/threonine protein kinase/rRNA-processing protein FCF1
LGINEFEILIEKDYKIFVDTSSLMQNDSEIVFFKIIAPLLHKHKKQLIIPKSVLNEISKHNYNKHKDIFKANHILDELSKFQLWGTNSKFDEQFADNALTSQFHSLRLKYNLCLITNDNSYKKDGNLSQDILDLKKSRSSEYIKDIKVFFIKNKGISEFKDKNSGTKYQKNKEFKSSTNNTKPLFKFTLPKTPKAEDNLLNPNNIPDVGSFIFDNNNKKHKLLKQIGRTGGEGSVYLTDSRLICKIYKKEKVTKFREEKIKLLIQHTIKIENVCLPEYIIYNNSKEFVGYLMPQAKGSEIQTSIFIPPLLKQKFPHWNRWHLAKIALNILQKIEKLHQHNIILGDINPNNILLNDETDIYFIDTDSFQIENYPCSVGMVAYTKKAHHGKRYEDYLRTKDDDIYAMATLIFQLMLPGKLPYSFSGGGSQKENMKPENFPYKCYDGMGYNNAPDGQWVYIWSHLPKKLKLIFCRVFKKNEKIALYELIKEIKNYLYQLDKDYQTKEIFPLTHKQIDADGNILKDDFKKFICTTCKTEFAVPNKQIQDFKAKGWKLPTKCKLCKNIQDPDLKKCLECEKTFKDKYNDLCKNCKGNKSNNNSSGNRNSNNSGGFLSSFFGW